MESSQQLWLIQQSLKKKLRKSLVNQLLNNKGNYPLTGALSLLSHKDISIISKIFIDRVIGDPLLEQENQTFEKSAVDFFTLVDDSQWFTDQSEQLEKLNNNLRTFFQEHSDFISQWMSRNKNSLIITIIEQLNYLTTALFSLLLKSYKRSQLSLKKKF